MTKTKVNLNKAHIVIADHDNAMVEILKDTLASMGLQNVTRVRSGREALDLIRQKPVDILITEWDVEPLNGTGLIKTLRQAEDARFAMLPVIMLTARGELPDVIEARDAGTTEFLIKPFTARTLYDRLEHVIDFPRDFIISQKYVGPDRRRLRKTKSSEERRITLPIILPEPIKMPDASKKQPPHKIIPLNRLKKKIGLMDSLSTIITPEILKQAQNQINDFHDESLLWVAQDMAKLNEALDDLLIQKNPAAIEHAKDALLAIKSHAGTFDFMLASNIAFALYGFLRNKFTAGNDSHTLICRKHQEVMQIILARQVKGAGGKVEQQLAEGLTMMTEKLQDA